MAIESLDKALDIFGPPVYVYHEIVHNRPVVERFRHRGAIFVDSMTQVPERSVLLFSAHGISPEVREHSEKRKIRAIDATCPLVTKVHLEALRFAKKGYTILLIGHKGHDEVVGTMGEAPDRIHLVQNVEEAQALALPPDEKLAYLTQTTLSVDDANAIIETLKNRFPQIVGPPKEDICYATQNRQQAVRQLTPEADVVLVLGSANSSNSQRLVEIAKDLSTAAYLIDGAEEIRREWLCGASTVLITAGASAPEDVVQRCVKFLRMEFNATVETRTLREESTTFSIPKALQIPHLPQNTPCD